MCGCKKLVKKDKPKPVDPPEQDKRTPGGKEMKF